MYFNKLQSAKTWRNGFKPLLLVCTKVKSLYKLFPFYSWIKHTKRNQISKINFIQISRTRNTSHVISPVISFKKKKLNCHVKLKAFILKKTKKIKDKFFNINSLISILNLSLSKSINALSSFINASTNLLEKKIKKNFTNKKKRRRFLIKKTKTKFWINKRR